jgi:hypothetical protein
VVNDQELILDSFGFGETGNICDGRSSDIEIYSAPLIKNLGHLKFFMRYEFDAVNSDFQPSLGIEKEYHDIESVWCEWGNPQPIQRNSDVDEDDDDLNRIKDPIDSIIVMKGSLNNGSQICFLCDRPMSDNIDVAALLDGRNDRIICCNWKVFSARNKGSGSININKVSIKYIIIIIIIVSFVN